MTIRFIQTVATEEKGIEELYLTIKENTKRTFTWPFPETAAQKAWQLIAESRMEELDQDELMQQLKRR